MTPEKYACRSRKPAGNLEEVLDFSLDGPDFFRMRPYGLCPLMTQSGHSNDAFPAPL